MTARRRSGRKSGLSNKKETPEKRRASRRRGKKSESEPEDDSASDQSVEESNDKRETLPKESEANKDEESAGSDGAWQVRSENGNKGGIPKLKISLTRPSDTSSPTPEPLASPKPRRSRRGATNEEASEDGEDSATTAKDTVSETSESELERRPGPSRRRKDKVSEQPAANNHDADTGEEETTTEAVRDIEEESLRKAQKDERLTAEQTTKNAEAEEAARLQVAEDKKARQIQEKNEQAKLMEAQEERIKQMMEEEVKAKKLKEDAEKAKKLKEDGEKAKKLKEDAEKAKIKVEEEERALQKKEDEERVKQKKKEEERVKRLKEDEDQAQRKKDEQDRKRKEHEEAKHIAERTKGTRHNSEEGKEREANRKSQDKEREIRRKSNEGGGDKEDSTRKSREEKSKESIDQRSSKPRSKIASGGDEKETGGDKQKAIGRGHRSPSRDSSVERAKQAALASRKPKRKSGSEDGEVVDNPETAPSTAVLNEHSSLSRGESHVSATKTETESKDSQDIPVVRKRRWGSSSTNQPAKKPLAISTDVLKEIIPEVKPMALNEVELSPNRDEITLDEEMSVERRPSKSEDDVRPSAMSSRHRRRSVASDESEKDYEEEGVESDGEEMVKKAPPTMNHNVAEEEVKEQPKVAEAVLASKALPSDRLEEITKQRSPSPAKHTPSSVLYITNLVRPFTVVQLRDLLARTGTIAEDNGFWIDSIKSRCFVKYTSEDDAKNTRHALHGIRWPASNPKKLDVDFGTETAMTNALEGGRPTAASERLAAFGDRRERETREKERRRERDEKQVEPGNDNHGREVRRVTERDRDRDRDRDADRERHRDDKPTRTVRKVTIPVREWDLGKAERGFSPPPPEDGRRLSDGARKREKERSLSLEPYKKSRKRDDAPPVKLLLDDLFRKTKATPCIYWLPLSAQQIAEKETQRRKHMEENEKRIAEARKRREAKRTRTRSPKK